MRLRAKTSWILAFWSWVACVAVQAQQTNGLVRELYLNVPGNAVEDLVSDPFFPDRPTLTDVVTNGFEVTTQYTRDPVTGTITGYLEDFGQRLTGFLVPPQDGEYTFWIASDDGAALYLSTDDTSAHKALIAQVNDWTGFRVWDSEPGQTSAALALRAGRRYYVEALMKQGGGDNHLSVRWQWPSGTVEEPIPASRLLPSYLPVMPPTIRQQPTSLTVAEGGAAVFSVRVANADRVAFQWYRAGLPLAGAVYASYTNTFVGLVDNGVPYVCALTNLLGRTNSQTAVLTVIPDRIPPTVVSVFNVGVSNVQVNFSEPVVEANLREHYGLDRGVAIQDVQVSGDGRTAVLTTSLLALRTVYTLSVSGIYDRSGAANPVAAGTQVAFTAAELGSQVIGQPALPTTFTAVGGGYSLSVTGGEVSGTGDRFQFNALPRGGDFEYQVRVQSLSAADPWAKVGLMARDGLATNSAFAAVWATPGVAGCFFQSRATNQANAAMTGSCPVNFPYTWLRLRRVGNEFAGYASLDGDGWFSLGSATLIMTNTVYLGVALAAHATNETAAAEVRGFASVAGAPTPGKWPEGLEPLGPSSRRTPVAVSEIMYHPAPRADGKDLEYVELYNSASVPVDLSAFRLRGDIAYEFPAGTTLPAGAFLVVAHVPAEVASLYALTNVVGPYQGALGNRSGTLRLEDGRGAVFLDLTYGTEAPWPAAADGAGHSLVLARPSYGEADPAAWAPSQRVGGSPGGPEIWIPEPRSSVLINEYLATAVWPELDFVELYNHSTHAVDLGACALSDDPATNKYVFPAGTTLPPRGFLVVKRPELGFGLSSAGDALYLTAPGRQRVLDAVRFGAGLPGVARGRCPDGAATIRPLRAPTPGAPNTDGASSSVVINEIMYHPLSGEADDSYVELHNPGTNALDLGGWKLAGGIGFTFPTNTLLPGGGYLVVARNAARLQSRYPNLGSTNLVGDFTGSLSKSGERLVLTRPVGLTSTNAHGTVQTTVADAAVNEVEYRDGGRWGVWADGGGSSLELIDPRADNRLAANWADSAETDTSGWVTIEHTGVLDLGTNVYGINAIDVLLQGPGECLVDDVQVIGPGGNNLTINSTFEFGTNNWNMRGTHVASRLEDGEGFASSRSLRLVATGRGDPGPNKVQGGLYEGLQPGDVVTIRAKARWLKGATEILFRLRGNYLEAAGDLTPPAHLGTPGARNSRWVRNAGPAIHGVRHTPVLPAAGEAVVVTARVSDPDGLAGVSLRYRIDPDTNFQTVPMTDDGKNGDEVAGDGLYSATIPGQPVGVLVAFHVQGRDGAFPAASSVFPSDAPNRECLVRFGEPQKAGGFATYRLWMTDRTRATWESRQQGSNEPLDVTFVYGRHRAIYNSGSYFHGSPWHWTGYSSPVSGNCAYNVVLPADGRFLGATELILMPPGNIGSDSAAQREQVFYWMEQQLGLVSAHRRFVHLFVNGIQRSAVFEDAQRPDGEYVEQWYPEDPDGDLYKIMEWFEYPDPVNDWLTDFRMRDATLERFATTGDELKVARYRWSWLKRAVRGSASDYRNLFQLVEAVNAPGDSYTEAEVEKLERLIDIDQWMRIMASRHVTGDWDSYGYRKGKNMYAYKPLNGRWVLLNWDMSFIFGNGDGPTTDLFDVRNLHNSRVVDPVTQRMFQTPVFRRAYLRALQDMIDGPFRDERLHPVLDANYASLLGNGVSLSTSSGRPTSIKTFVTNRRAFLQRVLATNAAVFSLTSNQGADFGTNRNLVTLQGTAPISVAALEVNGVSYPIQWTSVTNWSLQVPLQAGVNPLLVQGVDRQGTALSNAVARIGVTYTGVAERPQDRIAITEIMYHPSSSEAAYVELFNASTMQTFDLSGWRLRGVDFTFPDGTLLAPQSYLVVAKNRRVFAETYGADLPVVGDYAGQLRNGGETLSLVQPGATAAEDVTIVEVTYDNVAPWPIAADGGGASLQIVDPLQSGNRVANWSAVGTNGYAPGRWQYQSVSGVAEGSELTLSLAGPGEAIVDDVTVVAGISPVGVNLLANGGFESPLAGSWTWDADYAGSSLTTEAAHGGSTALRLVSASANLAAALRQQVHLVSGDFYTLSYWCLLSETSPVLTLRVEGQGLTSRPERLARYTPGRPNSVRGALGALPLLWINEVQPENTGAAATAAGKRSPWIELYNAGSVALDLGGFYLSDTVSNGSLSPLPAGFSVAPGRYLLVWADGEPGLSSAAEVHLGFRLAPGAGSVYLVRRQGGVLLTVDYLHYAGIVPGASVGGYPDGTSPRRQVFATPTPGAANGVGTAPIQVRINEWMADNRNTLKDPADGKAQDWLELFNAGDATVDLGGFTLTDAAAQPAKYAIPEGWTVAPRGFLLVWADGEPRQTAPTNGLHASFKLAKEGGFIGLFTPQGALADQVTYGAQVEDVSQGRSPDGGAEPFVTFQAPTPGGPNRASVVSCFITHLEVTPSRVSVYFTGTPGVAYQLFSTDQWVGGVWTERGVPVTLPAADGVLTDPAPAAAQRYYQIRAVGGP